VALPVSSDYLALALQSNLAHRRGKLIHQQVGNVELRTGELVACDPFVCLDARPFQTKVLTGTFPVTLSIEESSGDQRVAFASIRLKPGVPVKWEMLLVGDQRVEELKPGEVFGYPVDSGTGCFMDVVAAKALDQRMRASPDFVEIMIAEMEKTYRHTWSWLNMKFGDANLVAFSSGLGDGVYASYSGMDTSGCVSVIVTDFGVVDTEISRCSELNAQ
jgi:Protein of unknown function (DUF4241)